MEDTQEYHDQIAYDPEDDHIAFLPKSRFADTPERRRELEEMREWKRQLQAENNLSRAAA